MHANGHFCIAGEEHSCFFAYLPALALSDHFFRPRFHNVAPTVLLALLWLVLVHLASVRLGTFRCPRCNNLFASPEDSVTNTWTLARECKHCGLPKYGFSVSSVPMAVGLVNSPIS